MKSEMPTDPDRIRAILMRRAAERLGLAPACPARACLRNRHCAITAGTEPPCRQAAPADDGGRFDELFATIEAIRSLTLWPEQSRSDELRATEALAIDILTAALPLMPDFAPKFEGWLRRYRTWPTRPGDGRFWLKLAREEIRRHGEADRVRSR